MTRRQLVWRGLEEWLAEECTVSLDDDRLRARGVQLGAEPHPYRVDYELVCGLNWVTERFVATCGSSSLELLRSADGSWSANAEPLPDLEGALDCDLAFSPLTNYMPARRLGSEPVDGLYAFVEVPSLEVRPSRQRYEPIDERHVRFVSLDSDFTAELELDEEGLVVRYPRVAELVPSAARA